MPGSISRLCAKIISFAGGDDDDDDDENDVNDYDVYDKDDEVAEHIFFWLGQLLDLFWS